LKVDTLEEDYFLGKYLEPMRGKPRKFTLTRVAEEIEYCCVYSPDVKVASGSSKLKYEVFEIDQETEL
jgi:hypothetical protein